MDLTPENINQIADAIVNHPEFSGRLLGRVMGSFMSKVDIDAEKQRVRNLLQGEVDRALKINEWRAIVDDRLKELVRKKLAEHEKTITSLIERQLTDSTWFGNGNRVTQEFERAVQRAAQARVEAIVTGIQARIESQVKDTIKAAISGVDVKFNLGSIFDSRSDSDWDD